MKKLIILIPALLMLSTGLSAQSQWGIKGGLNFANQTNTDDTKMKPSIYLGVLLEFEVLDFMTIQPELVYSRQGFRFKEGSDKFWGRLNYLNLPIMAKFYVLDALSIDVGPQFGVMLNAKGKLKANGTTVKEDLENYKNFDVSFGVGASYKFLSNLDFTFRYNIGLTKLMDNTGGSNPKNSVIQLGVAYRW